MMITKIRRHKTSKEAQSADSVSQKLFAKLAASVGLLSMIMGNGCCTSRICHEGRVYRVDTLNLGLVRIDFEHRDKHARICHAGCNGHAHRDAHSQTSKAPAVIVNQDSGWQQQGVESQNQNRQMDINFDPVEVRPANTSQNGIEDAKLLQPVEHPKSSRRIDRDSTQNSNSITVPTMSVPFQATQSESVADDSLADQDKSDENSTGEMKLAQNNGSFKSIVNEQDTAQTETTSQHSGSQSATNEQTLRDPTTSPLREIAGKYEPPTPLERLAALCPPTELPGPATADNASNLDYRFSQQQRHLVEPMIRLRAIPILKKIPPRPSLAEFRDLPTLASDEPTSPKGLEVQQPVIGPVQQESSGRARDNWR